MRWHDLPHHDGSELYSPLPAGASSKIRQPRIRVPRTFETVSSAWLRVVIDGEPQFHPMRPVAAPIDGDDAQWWEGAFTVANPMTSYRFLLNSARGGALWLNAEGVDEIEPLDALDYRATAFPAPPAWASEQIMYQIFPDRFARSAAADTRTAPEWAIAAAWEDEVVHRGPDTPRQFFGGDLDGITERLDHLEALGVTLIYLTPFFPAQSNHRYDATTFDRVDPLLGGDEALIRLVEAAHARGIRVIGDLTTNHTGDAHEWFRRAYGDPSAAESDFYYWTDAAHTDYLAWYGVPSLPKLDWNSRELRRRFIEGPQSIVAKWLLPPYGLDGWRIDVANMTGRQGEDDLNALVQRTVRRTMDEVAPGSVLFAESTNDSSRDFDGSGWHAPMSYSAFTRPLWHWLRRPETAPRHHYGIPYDETPTASAEAFVRAFRRFSAPMPWTVRSLAMNAIDTHDTPRFADRADAAHQLVAAGLSFTLPGTPVLFAGDEFGLRGSDGEASRTPLPWGSDAGLAPAYARLSAVRAGSPALRTGGMRWLYADADALAFVRECEGVAELVVACRSAAELSLPTGSLAGRSLEASAPATLAFGDLAIECSHGVLRWRASGPALGVWSLGAAASPSVRAEAGAAETDAGDATGARHPVDRSHALESAARA